MTQMMKVNRGTFSLATFVSGQPEGAPWIVLSNSLGASSMMWEPQLELLGQRYRILRYDTRGHGQSDSPPAPYHFNDLVADVIALLDHYKISKAHYMGLSLGGMTGLGLALHHAARFDKIICCDARADNPPPFVKSWDDRIAAIESHGLQSIVHGTMERWFVEQWRKENPDRLQSFVDELLHTSVNGYKGCAQALKELDYFKDLGHVTLPMLYVVGENDLGASPDVMRAMAQATPGSAFIQIPHAAHLPNVDNTADFNRAIKGFLELQ
jgi:3-oxoadipate enol-lactonase